MVTVPNPRVYFGVGIAAGAAVGSVATYFAVNRTMKVKYAIIAEEEIESVRQSLEKMTIRDLEQFQALQEPKSPGGDSEETISDSPVEKALYERQVAQYQTADKSPTPYSTISTAKAAETVVEEVVEVQTKAEEVTPVQDEKTTPAKGPVYLVNEAEYDAEEWDDHSKVSLTYFEEDQVLIDDAEYLIRDVEDVVGPDALTSFGKNPNDPDIVRVRNLTLRMDYEIARDPRSFEEVVLRLTPDSKAGTG